MFCVLDDFNFPNIDWDTSVSNNSEETHFFEIVLSTFRYFIFQSFRIQQDSSSVNLFKLRPRKNKLNGHLQLQTNFYI